MGIRQSNILEHLWGLHSFKCDRADVLKGHVDLGSPSVERWDLSTFTDGQERSRGWSGGMIDGSYPTKGSPTKASAGTNEDLRGFNRSDRKNGK